VRERKQKVKWEIKVKEKCRQSTKMFGASDGKLKRLIFFGNLKIEAEDFSTGASIDNFECR
jgi:hypothetical protein